MKIVHVCLCGIFTDGLSYQDNLLTKYHVKAGYEVTVITSQWVYANEGIIKSSDTNYFNADGVKVIRLPIKGDKHFYYRLKKYIGVIDAVSKENPDILFIHGCQFLDILSIAKYLKHNKIKCYVDNHADFSNSATNFLSRHILHGVLWRYCAHKILPYAEQFYGVLPARVDFLIDVYRLPKEKVELLIMGVDDELVAKIENSDVKNTVRENFNIAPEDFLIVTGGKIDMAKRQTLFLMEAVKKINDERVKLVIFGSIEKEIEDKVFQMCDGKRIQYMGWADNEMAYSLFYAADLVVFPGRHSVYWEQVVGLGKPLIVKYWEGTTHIDIGGNVVYLYEDGVDCVLRQLIQIVESKELYENMVRSAQGKGKQEFYYSNIAKKSIKME